MIWEMAPEAIALCLQLAVSPCDPGSLYPAAWRAKLYDYQIGCNTRLGVCPPKSIVRDDECVFVGAYGYMFAFMCRRQVKMS